MSFILDALKKAESERTRHSGPVLMDVRIAPSRQRLPLWAWAIGCVLLANLLLLAWLVLRKPDAATPAVAASASATPVPAPPAPAPPAVAAPAPAAAFPAVPAVSMQPPSEVIPATLPAPAPVVATTPPPADNLPTFQEVLASGAALPQLQMILHVYDEVPANRYVLLNSKRLHEGEELSDGIRVERITSRGVVIDARGRRFLLPAGG